MNSGYSAQNITTLARRHESRVLAAMLLLLHLSTWWDFGDNLSKSLMLAHLGLFFMWQPIWRGDLRVDLAGGFAVFLFTLGFVLTLNWWTLICWLVILIGLVGGRSLSTYRERFVYMLTLAFLISKLVIRCIPQVAGTEGLGNDVVGFFRYGLLLLPMLMLFVPTGPDPARGTPTVDLLRALTVSLMTAMFAQSALLITHVSAANYAVALIESMIVLAVFLLIISWLLSRRTGTLGLAQLWERSLLNIGTPFENWLAAVSALADQQQTPREFLEYAMLELGRLPWVSGVHWQSEDGDGSAGVMTPYVFPVHTFGLDVRLNTFRPAGPMLALHSKLLVELVSHFYVAKLREQELAKQAQLRAVYETGARVTHDIKNLLQSLQAITLVLVQDRNGDPGSPTATRRGQQLLEKQLPLITQRLQLALDKLQSPEKTETIERPLAEWWESLIARNQTSYLRFDADMAINPAVPTDLFDSIAENLLENVRNKRQLEPAVNAAIELQADSTAIILSVTDNGSAVPPEKATTLFRQPVDSHFGLGIGLYQAAKQAQLAGYQLSLAENRTGRVRFELRGDDTKLSGDAQYPLFVST
jgi:signal transduction histidine kinase